MEAVKIGLDEYVSVADVWIIEMMKEESTRVGI